MDGSLVAYGFAQFITTTVAFKFLDFVYFGAIISATDPVTILTIFQVSSFQILRLRSTFLKCLELHLSTTRILLTANSAHCLGMNYYVNFFGGIGSNGFHTHS